MLKKLYKIFQNSVSSVARIVPDYFDYVLDFVRYKKLASSSNTIVPSFKEQYPCLSDKTATTYFEPHYSYHLAWAARILARSKPEKHIDISSSLAFNLMVSAFIPIEFYDYRPAEIKLDNFYTGKADLASTLPFTDNTIQSLSCMHVVEHVGLGRYGDKLDPGGDIKAINELMRVLAPGGKLLFVVPVGKASIRFNAHRIYSYKQIIGYFSDLKLLRFDLLPDDYGEGMIYDAVPEITDRQKFGCGCFLFTK